MNGFLFFGPVCPPSAKLCEGIKDEPSPYAQEGTDCHELCAYLVEKALGRDVEDPTENLTYYSGEMQNCAEEYRDYVLEQFERSKKFCSDPMVFIEQRLDFSRWVENGFGTGDYRNNDIQYKYLPNTRLPDSS